MFTLFIKATTIWLMMKKFWVGKLHELEEFEYQEWRILAYLKMLEKLDSLYHKNYLTINEVNDLRLKYESELKEATESLKNLIKSKWVENWNELVKRAISLHALWIEKQYLKDLYTYNEIEEKNFKYILNKIDRQIERLEAGKPQLKDIAEDVVEKDIFQKIVSFFSPKNDTFVDSYITNRTKAIITRKVIKELKNLSNIDFGFDKSVFDDIISLYQNFNKVANEKKDMIFEKHKTEISLIERKLVDKSLLKLEESVIKDLFKKEIITPKLYIKFIEEIEAWILKDVKTI